MALLEEAPDRRDFRDRVPSSRTRTGTCWRGLIALNASENCSFSARFTGWKGIDMPFSAMNMRTRRELGDAGEW
jgi:hypothetical protein